MSRKESAQSLQQPREHGTVLILAVFVMAATLTMGLSFLLTSTAYLETQAISLERIRARALAESAVELAYRDLQADANSRGSFGPVAVGEGFLAYEIDVRAGELVVRGSGLSGSVTQSLLSNAGGGSSDNRSRQHVVCRQRPCIHAGKRGVRW